ncbi:hypothetical protein ACP4OV_023774 [Aristida adscensionis]
MAMWQTTSVALAIVLLSMAMLAAQVPGARSTSRGNSVPKATVDDLVVEACKKLSNGLLSNWLHFDEESCVSVLRSDKRSAAAKDHGDLVLIAFDLLDHNSNAMALKIKGILQGIKVHNWTQRKLQYCAADYGEILTGIPVCRDMFLELKLLGKKAPCFDPIGDDANDVLGCLDGLQGFIGGGCSRGLVEGELDVGKYVSLVWGLVEMATDCVDNSAT